MMVSKDGTRELIRGIAKGDSRFRAATEQTAIAAMKSSAATISTALNI